MCSERNILFLCKNCEEKLIYVSSQKPNLVSENYSFKVRRVFVWDRGTDDIVRNIIYALKYGHDRKVYANLSKMLLSQINYCEKLKDICFIPAPGKFLKPNHALLFASCLGELTNSKVLDILIDKGSKLAQKYLSKKQRSEKIFKIKKKVNLSDKKVIFVDDVITTGSTAMAAYEALLHPRDFEVWVLAEKTLDSY